MRKPAWRALAMAVLGSAVVMGSAQADDQWVTIPQEDLLYMDISGGTVVIEMYPDAAPGHIARMRELSHEGFFNNLTFHRVIEDFMAQGGDPLGNGEGGSSKPDLKAEFTFHFDPFATNFGVDRDGDTIGVDGASIVLTEPDVMQYSRADGKLRSWIPQCRGTVAMARASNPNSGNSQFYIMFSDTHRDTLDHNYTAWGRIVEGMGAVDRIQRGEPPSIPTRIYKMSVGTDLPPDHRLTIETLSPSSPTMKQLIDDAQAHAHGRLNVCDIDIPVRIIPKSEEKSQ
jgi:peptidylprolyl isomerase